MRKLRPDEIVRITPDEASLQPRHPVAVVVDDVRSIYNVGSIFRTSDAAWINHVYLTGITGTPAHRGLRKTALGAEETVPWRYARDAGEVVAGLKAAGYTIAALEITDTPTPFSALETAHFPLGLLVGNEVEGVRADLLDLADLALEIPQYGAKQSLNVAVAYGIAVFAVVGRYRTLRAGDEAGPGSLPLPDPFRTYRRDPP